LEFRLTTPDDVRLLAEIFADIDQTFFRPHPFTDDEAVLIANHLGPDTYAILLDGQRPVAYGMLRGWEEGYTTPSLGIAVRTSSQGRGFGRRMMVHLHEEALRRGATVVRLRVHHDNVRARRLYESMGYRYAGEERGELVMLLDLHAQAGQRSAPDPDRTGGMVVRLLDIDAPRWASFLRETPHDFYHLPGYVALCAAHEQGEGRALYVEEGAASLLLPLILRDIPGSDGRDATSPYGYPGPLVNGTDDLGFLSIAMAAGLGALGEEGIVSVFVRLHPLLNASPPVGVGEVVLHGETVSIDLSLPQATRSAQMRHNHRRDISRAVKHGLVARMDDDFIRYDSFKEIYRETMARRGATQYYQFDDDYFDGLRDALCGHLHLGLVEWEGAVAAAGLFVETDGIVQFHLGGTEQTLATYEPSKLLVSFAAEWAKLRGNRFLHLGGGVGGANDSLFHYKAGFSPLRHPFRTLRAVTDGREYARLVAAHGSTIHTEQAEGYFPLYRMA
jgi:ribosomal protein S18 acetylase RimI-like enzyme